MSERPRWTLPSGLRGRGVVSYDETWVEELVSQMVDLGPPWRCWRPRAGWNCRWWPHWPLRRCRWWWSTRVKFETSPGQPGRWPRPDALDAAVLAHFADSVRPSVRPLRDAETQVLNSLAARRRQVMTMLVSERNRLNAATVAVRPRIEAHIAWLKQELDDLDRRGAPASFRSLVAQGRRRAIAGRILLKDDIADVVGWL